MQPNLFPKNGKIEDGRTGGQGVGLFIRAVDLGRRQIGKSGQWRQLGPVRLKSSAHVFIVRCLRRQNVRVPSATDIPLQLVLAQ